MAAGAARAIDKVVLLACSRRASSPNARAYRALSKGFASSNAAGLVAKRLECGAFPRFALIFVNAPAGAAGSIATDTCAFAIARKPLGTPLTAGLPPAYCERTASIPLGCLAWPKNDRFGERFSSARLTDAPACLSACTPNGKRCLPGPSICPPAAHRRMLCASCATWPVRRACRRFTSCGARSWPTPTTIWCWNWLLQPVAAIL